MKDALYAMTYTLGCRVNACESLSFADRLAERGFTVLSQDSVKIPDVVFINTCAVTAESARKSRQIVRRFRQKYPAALIIAAGCLCQSGDRDIDADIVFGSGDKDSIASLAVEYCKKRPTEQIYLVGDIANETKCSGAVYTTHYKDRAHIKIEDGCSNRCAYCIIPRLRGKVRSKAPDELLCEIAEKVKGGSFEILLTGIETGAYGKDLDGIGLIDVLERADRIPGLYLIRLGSLDPYIFNDDFIERFSKLEHIERHIHLSVQSGCSKILAGMKRRYNAETLLERVEKIYKAMPDVCLTADIITGFPGETDEDFAKTLEFAKKAEFLHIHIFPYSEREGTVAATMEGSVPVQIRRRRAAQLAKLCAESKAKKLASAVGTVQTVHFESRKSGMNVGYTRSYMPVRVEDTDDLHGKIIPVSVVSTDGKVLYGKVFEK